MSVLEKKALAFERLAALQSEAVIDEILAHLEKLNNEDKANMSATDHANSIINERSEVLKKLAK